MTDTMVRRELNRERTRRALYEAVLALIETKGPEALTVDEVAEAAGVSRRTFFNYYPSIDALIAAGVDDLVAELTETMAARPADETLHETVIAVVEQVITVDRLSAVYRVWRAVDRSPAAARRALESMSSRHEDIAHEWARDRLFGTRYGHDFLRESVVMAVYAAAFDQARRYWLRSQNGPIDQESLDRFLGTVRRAFELVRPVAEAPVAV